MACFLIIVLYFQFQFSYDQFHVNKDRIYRVNKHLYGSKGEQRISYTAPFVSDYIKQNISEVDEVIRFSSLSLELHYKDKGFQEFYIYACDSMVFDVFSFNLTKGNPQNALSAPNSIVLSESFAIKYFGDEDPMDKMLMTYDEKGVQLLLKVTGIMEDVPQNSHIQINSLISMATIKHFVSKNWYEDDWHGTHTYLFLKEDADPDQVQNRIDQILLEQVPLQGYNTASLPIQPITSIFFNPTKDGSSQRGSKSMTVVLLILGLFILFIASLNYINLTTARSLKRSQEIGVRKVLGAERKHLISQFLGESILISFAALILGVIIMQFFIPYLNKVSNVLYKINLDSEFLSNRYFLLVALGTAFLNGLISGAFPAFVMAGFNPTKSLKGITEKRGSISMRKSLVVIQYIVSVIMIVGSIGIYKVYHFMISQDLGFNKEHLLAVSLQGLENDPRIQNFKIRLNNNPYIHGLAATSKVPMSLRDDYSRIIKDPASDQNNRVITLNVDENYFGLLEIPYIKPPQFMDLLDNDKEIMVVNETFMNRYGEFYQIGDHVELLGYNAENQTIPLGSPEIVGSVKDIKGRSLILSKPTPKVYLISNKNQNYLLARLSSENQQETLNNVERVFKEEFPEKVFQYSFVDDEINTFMSIFNPFAKMIFFGTFFAILIASIGLFALALFITQQKTKEIGIRKIFGASIKNISLQLAKQFIKLVLIAFIIAGPITFFGFRKMLQILPERIVLEWSLLLVIGLGIIILAVGTVLLQSWSAARADPVTTLRYE
jgi:putative ABC transport system permease protein